jgi:hypothetical protein
LPRYRFVAIFDDDRAGRQAVRAAREWDHSIIEFKDVFRLRPIMPMTPNADPTVLERQFRVLTKISSGSWRTCWEQGFCQIL